MRTVLLMAMLGGLLTMNMSSVFAQPDTLWTRTYGGSGVDVGRSVQQTTDGGYVIVGSTYGAGGSDFWLIKTDDAGDTLWTRTFDESDLDDGRCVQQTTDGGYIIAGNTYEFGPCHNDIYLLKTDANGDRLWNRAFGGSRDDGVGNVQQTTDGGYIITGNTCSYSEGHSDVWLIKTDANGDSLWTRTFGGRFDNDFGSSCQQTSDGGYIIAGGTCSYSVNFSDVWLIKTDGNGDSLWTRIFGRNDFNTDYGFSVRQTSDGGYIIIGTTYFFSGGSSYDVRLIKTDANGDNLWTRTFGGSEHDKGYSVQQTNDGGYIVAGYTSSYGEGHEDVWLIKTDANGNEQWNRTFGGSYYDYGHSVQQTTDGGYIVVGQIMPNGPGSPDVWLIRIDSETSEPVPAKFSLEQNYPNPFNASTVLRYSLPRSGRVRLVVYNVLGQRVGTVFEGVKQAGTHNAVWDGGDVSSGIYFAMLFSGGRSATVKMVLLK